jgi:hypothetical protein
LKNFFTAFWEAEAKKFKIFQGSYSEFVAELGVVRTSSGSFLYSGGKIGT